MNIKESLMMIFAKVGFYGPFIFMLLGILLFRNTTNYLIFFVIGNVLNNLLNVLLKILIKQPRPEKDNLDMEMFLNHQTLNDKPRRQYWDKYGMPSSHAQNCGFLTMYIALLTNNTWTYLCLAMSFITMAQRYVYNNHTILQLIVGYSIGLLFGAFMVYLATYKIKGKLHLKPDDNMFDK